MSIEEQTILFSRYEQLVSRWKERWPDEEPPPLGGDAIRQIRTIQAIARRLRDAGVDRGEGGLRKGPGMLVEDGDLRRRIEEAQAAGRQLPEPQPVDREGRRVNGDPTPQR